MPSSLCDAPRLKSRRNADAALPLERPDDQLRRGVRVVHGGQEVHAAHVVRVEGRPAARDWRVRVARSVPKLMPLASSVTDCAYRRDRQVSSTSRRWSAESASVISSARRWMAPGAKTCGVLRWTNWPTRPVRNGSRWTFGAAVPDAVLERLSWHSKQPAAFGPVTRNGVWLNHSPRALEIGAGNARVALAVADVGAAAVERVERACRTARHRARTPPRTPGGSRPPLPEPSVRPAIRGRRRGRARDRLPRAA